MDPFPYSLSPEERLAVAVETFQRALGSGDSPRIEDYLSAVDDRERQELLSSLLRCEIDFAMQAGTIPRLEDYIARFAADEAVVRAVWQSRRDDETTIEAPQTTSTSARPMIGPYKLLQKIGEGGMGEVWMAEQQHPIRRRVALKLIKSDSPSNEIIARFEAERQALAMMDHPHIAKVLDAGQTKNGQPYFVMDLVQGIPITEFCNRNRLSPRERLELFVSVCSAIQHAHQKGIIHRDIKPSNVLVARCDGEPIVKVIDFGLAKAVQAEQRLTDRTLFTEFGCVVGTLQYMSPEQAELNSLDVDTRADIYSLGVMLYELLTGSTPLEHEHIKHGAILAVLQMIRQQDPPTPSKRLTGSGDAIHEISAQRRIDASQLCRILKGDLDWVVMKALEKDRSRRYETASGLAEDLRRFLQSEPVQLPFRTPPFEYLLIS